MLKPLDSQVGIIALNLIGEPLQQAPEGPPGFLDTEGPTSHELPYYNRAAGELAELQLDVHVDSTTAARIKVRRDAAQLVLQTAGRSRFGASGALSVAVT